VKPNSDVSDEWSLSESAESQNQKYSWRPTGFYKIFLWTITHTLSGISNHT